MKRLIFFLLAVISCSDIFSQIEFRIQEMHVSNIKTTKSKNIDKEFEDDGPYLNFKCILTNISESVIILHPSKSRFLLTFYFQGDRYQHELIDLAFSDHDSISLTVKNPIEVSLGINILLGTPILKNNKMDYTEEMLKILPTIKILYNDQDKIKIKSDEIINVILN